MKEAYSHCCDECGVVLWIPSSARIHSKTHKSSSGCLTNDQRHLPNSSTRSDLELFECEVCQEAFINKSLLNGHMKVHNERKVNTCLVCSMVFMDKRQLKQHAKEHITRKCFKCSECGDTFSTSHRLKRHFMIHTGERPFQCEECGVPFREYATLQAHMGTHLPRGPYPCELCGEVFLRLNSLTLHKRVHNTNGTYKYISRRMEEKLQQCSKKENVSGQEKSPEQFYPKDQKFIHDQVEMEAGCTTDPMQPATAISCNSKVNKEESKLESAKLASDVGCEMMTTVEAGMLNVPHPDVVRDILATGTVLESQGQDGQGYLIVLPKALTENDYTLIEIPSDTHVPTLCENLVLSESEEPGESNCDLLVWDSIVEAETEVPFEQEKICLSEKPKKKKMLKTSSECTATNDMNLRNSLTFKRKEKKTKDTKVRIPKCYECQHCEKDCKTSSSLNIHLRTHTGERPYYCDYCNVGFKQLAHLKAHVRIHTGEQPFKCNLCDAAFIQACRLKSHQKTHIAGKIKEEKIERPSIVKNFYCKVCDKTFLGSCYKKQHMRTHVDDSKYDCDKCTAHFKSKNSLRKHRRNHIDDSWGVCEECGLRFISIETLDVHMRVTHARGFMGNLDNCSSKDTNKMEPKDYNNVAIEDLVTAVESVDTGTSRSSDANKVHKVYSTKAKFVFNSSNHLSKGKMRNNNIGPKSYSCCICKKSFKQSSNLLTHTRMHTGERPYKCDNCGKSFRQISHLKDHFKMHTGEKPFKCSMCPAAFPQSSGAKYHIHKNHEGRAHVVKEKQPMPEGEVESITLLEIHQAECDTVVINVGKGMSVSLEHHKIDIHNKTVTIEGTEQCLHCGESMSSCAHKCLIQGENCSKSMFTATTQPEWPGEDIRESVSEFLSFNMRENLNEKNLIESCRNECSAESIETSGKVGTNYENDKEWSTVQAGSSSSIIQVSGDGGNVCDVCGKVFRRASALKFHKRMNHNSASEELIEEEECITKWKSRDYAYHVKARKKKCYRKI